MVKVAESWGKAVKIRRFGVDD